MSLLEFIQSLLSALIAFFWNQYLPIAQVYQRDILGARSR